MAELDVDLEFPEVPEIDRKKILTIRKTAKQHLNLNKTLGMPNWFIFHLWNQFMILNAIVNYMLYCTTIFGHYNKRRGIVSTYVQMYIAIPISVLYFMTWCAGNQEKIHLITWLFKCHLMCLVFMILCYAMDGLLYVLDHHAFC